MIKSTKSYEQNMIDYFSNKDVVINTLQIILKTSTQKIYYSYLKNELINYIDNRGFCIELYSIGIPINFVLFNVNDLYDLLKKNVLKIANDINAIMISEDKDMRIDVIDEVDVLNCKYPVYILSYSEMYLLYYSFVVSLESNSERVKFNKETDFKLVETLFEEILINVNNTDIKTLEYEEDIQLYYKELEFVTKNIFNISV